MTDYALEAVARDVCTQRGLVFRGGVGAGSYKETFRAEAPGGQSTALKVYRSTASTVRASREIDAMLLCDHSNIAKVKLVDVIDVGGWQHVYCLEEFLGGGTLARAAAATSTRQFTPARARAMLRVLADALGHLHQHGLVHRDLKPENIMLRDDGRTPVIVDFGIVRNLAESSVTPTWLQQGPCTPFYAPAEQLENQKLLIDWRADQFSLGVTFSILALGLHPYADTPNDNPHAVVQRVAEKRTPTPMFVAAATGAGLDALVRMVAPWPVGRFRTPGALVAAWSE